MESHEKQNYQTTKNEEDKKRQAEDVKSEKEASKSSSSSKSKKSLKDKRNEFKGSKSRSLDTSNESSVEENGQKSDKIAARSVSDGQDEKLRLGKKLLAP